MNPSDSTDRQNKNMFLMPMGLVALANRMHEHGVDVEVLHLDIEISLDPDMDLRLGDLDAVGLSLHWANQSRVVMDTAAMIRDAYPNAFIFLGGYTSSFFHEEILAEHPQIDAVIRGDAEDPILQLCDALSSSAGPKRDVQLAAVQNLTWRRMDGAVAVNPISFVATAENIGQLDFADMSRVRNWRHYRDRCRFWTRSPEIRERPLFLLEVGRGCRYLCTFCGGNARAQKIISNRHGQVTRSVSSAMETVREAVSNGFGTIYTCFESDASDPWYLDLFERIRLEGLGISFVYGSWSLPSEAIIDAATAACDHVLFELSPETADEELRFRNKDRRLFYSNAELEERVRYMGTKPTCRAQLYFGYPVPFDNLDAVRRTIAYIRALVARFPHIEPAYTFFSTDPGSLLFLDPDRYDVAMRVRSFADYLEAIRRAYGPESTLRPDLTLFRPKTMTPADALEGYRQVIALFGR